MNHKIVPLINYVLQREDLSRNAASDPRTLGFDLMTATSLHGQRNPHGQTEILTFVFDMRGFTFEDVITKLRTQLLFLFTYGRLLLLYPRRKWMTFLMFT
jgi:hypothetical protein